MTDEQSIQSSESSGAITTAGADSNVMSELLPFKWEMTLFRDALENVNDTLRMQMSIAGGFLAACVTVLNIFPVRKGIEVLDYADKYVFVPVLISMAFSYRGLEHHWNYEKRKAPPPVQLDELYTMIAFKYRMLHIASALLSASAVLLAIFILLEFG